MEWLKKLQYAIDYIEENLDKEIFYDEAARIACCSTYYFQRMFTYITGITLSEYIRRRRMTCAAFELQTTNIKIMDIALKYGYTSPTAFNRAFQNVHNVSPSAARKYGTSLNAYSKYYIASSTDKDKPKHMFEYIIPKATWVIFESKGPFKESIQSIFKRFLIEWLPFSNYEYAHLPDIEVYPITSGLSSGYSEVWIAVKKAN